jgi:signal transduction histidine kinase
VWTLATPALPRDARSGAIMPSSVLTANSSRKIGWWDSTAVERVIANLPGNALKYSPSGQPVAITIKWAGDMDILSVGDRGVGIRQ